MNVLFLVHYPELYGSIRSLLDLVSGLKEFGIIPHFILPAKGGLSDFLDQQGDKYTILKAERWVSEHSVSIKGKIELCNDLLRTSDQIRNFIEQWSIELIYTNTIVSPAGLIAARRSHLPHIWHIREYYDLYFGWKYMFPDWLSNFSLSRSDAIICHARGIKQHYFSSSPANVHQVYNGVATIPELESRLQTRLSTPSKQDFTFAMLSNINPKKNQELAILALAKLRDKDLPVKLVIVGNGKPDYVNKMQQLVIDLKLTDRVSFTGLVDDPFPYYFAADCVLICSEFEALSRVGLEAMSTALPVIGRNSGGNPEIIEHGTTGFLYDSFEELVARMKTMVEDPGAARQMGLAGWQRARNLFNIEDYSANVYRVIQSVMEKR